MVLVLLTSLNCCMSTLHLVHYALLLTPVCWKSNNTNARLMASALSIALDPPFGIHSHKTLDTAQPCHLLKPNWKPSSSHSISILTNISTQFLLHSVFVVHFYYYFLIILYVNCFGRTMLYICIEYHIYVNMYHVSAQGIDERMISVHYYYYNEVLSDGDGMNVLKLCNWAVTWSRKMVFNIR